MRTSPRSGSKKLFLILILLLGGISASALTFPFTFLPASLAGKGSFFSSFTNQAPVTVRSITVDATVSTDKGDYKPGEIVQISGTGFWPNETVTLQVVHVESSNLKTSSLASLTEYDHAGHEPWQVTAGPEGTFASSWLVQEDSLNKTLLLTADQVATADHPAIHAETTFTDASIGTYDQCSNDEGEGYPNGDQGCRWINGNLNGNNSSYPEGDATVQRVWLTGFEPNSVHTITFQYGTTKNGKHAYDFLTRWDWSENWITLADRCQDIAGCTTATEVAANMLEDPELDDTIEFAEPARPRQFVMRGAAFEGANPVSAPDLDVGTYDSTSETLVSVTFKLPASGPMCETKQGVTTCGVAIWFGAHVSRSDHWTAFDGTEGASNISGSPYHVALFRIDDESIGQRDNQMQASAVSQQSLEVRKELVPDTDPGRFNLRIDAGTATEYIEPNVGDGGTTGPRSVSPGNHTVSETGGTAPVTDLSNYTTTLSCVTTDENGDETTQNYGSVTSQSVSVPENGDVVCTFTNTAKPPDLDITKTADAASVSAGSPIGFTVTVSNSNAAGTGTAKGVTLNDPLPAGSGVDWSIASQSGGANCTITGSVGSEVLSCGPIDLAPGASFSVRVTSPTTEVSCASYPNTASATATNHAQVQAQASTTVQCPDIDITKTADAATVSAGTSIGFTITVSNSSAAGTGTATAVTLNDPLPGGTGINWSISPAYAGPGTCQITGSAPTQTLSCSFGDLAPGASASVHVVSSTSETACAVYPNTATADATNHAAVQAQASTEVTCPDLDITKTADAAFVSAGSQIGFTISVTNSGAAGTGTAVGVTLSDPLPAGAGVDWSIQSQTGSANCVITGSVGSEVLNCGPINLAAGAGFSVYVVSGTTEASCKAYPNTATADAANHAAIQAQATTTVRCPDISIQKVADAATVNAGSPIGFTITVSNSNAAGTGTATSVTLNDPLPGGTGVNWSINPAYPGPGTCQITGTAPNQMLTCSFGDMAPGATASVHIVSSTTEESCKVYANTATADATNDAPVEAQASITVRCPSITVEKEADDATVSAGSQIGFTITVTNNSAAGTGTAAGVTLNDPLPAGTGVDWLIASQSGGASCVITGSVGSEVLSCGPIDLAPGANFSVHVVSGTTEASCKAYPNTATADATNHAAVQAQATTTVQCPDLQILKSASSGTIDAGTTATFTITVTNLGPGTATNVTLDDVLPAGVAWAIAGGTGAALCVDPIVGNALDCNFGDMTKDASFSVVVSGLTDAADCGTLSNTAVADSDNDAPVQSSANITVQCGRIRVDKVTVPAGDPQSFAFSGSFSFNLTHSSALFDSGLIAPGQYSVVEGELAGWDLTGLDCNDTNSVEDIEDRTATVNLEGNETVTCTFTNSKLPTLIVRKVIQGSSETFNFVIDGNPTDPPNPNVELTPPTDDEAQTPTQIIELGDYRVTETPIPDGWLLSDASCVSDQTGFVTDNSGIPIGNPWVTFTARYGDDVVCSFFDNEQGGATRTQGFWSTHTVLTNAIWNGTPLPPGTSSITPTQVAGSPDAFLCFPPDAGDIFPFETGTQITAIPLTGQNQVLGGFWANISKKSNGGKRSALDQARMQLLQQYLAAVLNVHAFGTPIGTTTLANARNAYCSNNANNILAQKNLLAAYNEGGDSVEFTPGVNATAKLSRDQANIPFWDNTLR